MTKALTKWQTFEAQLEQRTDDLFAMLPPHIDPQRFKACALTAVKQDPELVHCTPRSLFGAFSKAAQDGLMPDAREGVITRYRNRVKQPDGGYRTELQAQWNPMVYGLRKRARELDDVIAAAEVVYENDAFLWRQGDDPGIDHAPAQLGTDRGQMIGAYAIFRRGDEIIHREVMDRDAIERVKKQSKAPGGLLWTTFEPEAWRKTVVRRGFKSVPVGEAMNAIVQRDDANYTVESVATDHARGVAKALPPRVSRSDPPEVIQGTAETLPDAIGPDDNPDIPDSVVDEVRAETAQEARTAG